MSDLDAMLGDHIEVIDRSFGKLVLNNSHLDTLWTGGRWLEGPAWFGDSRTLVFSDIPNNRMLRYDATTGGVAAFRSPSDNSNGNTRDRQGRLVTCEHRTRRVTRTELDGTLTVLADRFAGSGSTRPTTWWSAPTGRSGSPIRPTASTATTRATPHRRDRREPSLPRRSGER